MEESGYLSGSDGNKIFWQGWRPADNVKALVIIAHGLGEHIGKFGSRGSSTRRASRSSRSTTAATASSGGKRGHITSFKNYLDDLDDLPPPQRPDASAGCPVSSSGTAWADSSPPATSETRGDLAGLILSSAALRVDVDAPAIKLAWAGDEQTLAPSSPPWATNWTPTRSRATGRSSRNISRTRWSTTGSRPAGSPSSRRHRVEAAGQGR